jgi:methylaspartate mutase sigma subunit
MRRRLLAVLATTPDDSHMWNLNAVQEELEDRGFEVINLGACTPADLLAEAIRDRRPELAVISTVNGHGARSAIDVMDILRLYQADRIGKVIIGGKLTTDAGHCTTIRSTLIDAGFAEVFVGRNPWGEFDAFLSQAILKPKSAA